MRTGEHVFHIPTGRHLTVSRIDSGSQFVLCSWFQPKVGMDGAVERLACSCAYKWDELRYPTAAEKAAEEKRQAAEAVGLPDTILGMPVVVDPAMKLEGEMPVVGKPGTPLRPEPVAETVPTAEIVEKNQGKTT